MGVCVNLCVCAIYLFIKHMTRALLYDGYKLARLKIKISYHM